MSQSDDYGDEGQNENGGASNWRRDLEARARAGDEALARLAALEAEAPTNLAARRKLAIIEAGIDTNTPLGKIFADKYTGEATKDAVLAEAAAYQIVTPVPDAERQAHQRLADAGAGGGQLDVNTDDQLMAELRAAGDWANGGSAQKVIEWVRQNGGRIDTSDAGDWWESPGKYTGPAAQ